MSPPDRAGTSGEDIAIDEILVACGPDRLEAAIVARGRLEDFVAAPRRREDETGSIYLGRIVRRLPGIGGVLVDIGLDRPALLDSKRDQISDGTLVRVQVIEPGLGDKGPRVSLRLAIAGRHVVLLPGGRGTAPSRRLDPAAARRLAAAGVAPPAGHGLLWRWTAGQATGAMLAAEVDRLAALWRRVDAEARSGSRPGLLHDDTDGLGRLLRELGGRGAPRFVFDDPAVARAAAAIARAAYPDLEARIETAAGDGGRPASLFDRHDIATARAQAAARHVELPSGGRLTVDATAALTAIDVDSARASAEPDARRATNLEAAREIGRQLRLRDLGGIVLVDFLRRARPDGGTRLLDVLARAVAFDRVGVEVLGFTRGGLVEIVRPRVRAGEGAA